jgi:hypothetical protein
VARTLLRGLALLLLLVLAAPVPGVRASGETLTASPTRGAPGAAVRLDYETNYGPGGCEPHQVVQLFFDASPLATAAMDPSHCGAARTVYVPRDSCGRHVFRAAWRTGQDPTLYGEASAPFDVLCTAPRPTRPAPRPAVGATVSTASPSRPPATRPPVQALPPSTAPAVVPEVTPSSVPQGADRDDSGTPWLRWSLLAAILGAVLLLALLSAARRRRP